MGEIILKGYQCERCSHKETRQEGLTIPKYYHNVNHRIGISLERFKRRNTI